MKIYFLLLISFAFVAASSQTNFHFLNLERLEFPSKIDTIQLNSDIKYFRCTSDNFYAAMVYTKPDDSVYNEKKFHHYLQIFIEGFFSSENWKYHNREQVDSTVGGVKGKLVHGF